MERLCTAEACASTDDEESQPDSSITSLEVTIVRNDQDEYEPNDTNEPGHTWRRYPSLLVLAIVALMTTVALIVADYVTRDTVWSSITNHVRCEETVGREHRLLREPANAMSNIVDAVVSMYILLCALYDWRWVRSVSAQFGLSFNPMLSVVYSVAVFFLSFGSFWYHACAGCSLGGYLDILSVFIMPWTIVCLAAYILASILFHRVPELQDPSWRDRCYPWITIVIWAAGSCGCTQWGEMFDLLGSSWQTMYYLLCATLAALIAFLMVLMRVASQHIEGSVQLPYALGLSVSSVLSLAAWAPEEVFQTCIGPADSAFQLHALWHVGVAVVVLVIYLYLRSLGYPPAAVHSGWWGHVALCEPPPLVGASASESDRAQTELSTESKSE